VNAAVAVLRLANARMDANDFIFDTDEKRLLVHATRSTTRYNTEYEY